MSARRLIVLDRDGVINEDRQDYVKSADEWKPLPGSLEAIARLVRSGYDVVVATNQAGIGHGLYTRAALDAVHRRMRADVEAAGGALAGIYICPHRPQDACDCRKPLPGLLRRIAADFTLELDDVPFVGDKITDVMAAQAVGARAMFVRSGGRDEDGRQAAALGVPVYADLAEAVDALLGE